ncbi:hypothetical protein DFH09DRAFT_1087689 [Mycena vulgaris]|nr:hypothetical protein DFH09DRAFT_1087689 [Mycena vulgaris]
MPQYEVPRGHLLHSRKRKRNNQRWKHTEPRSRQWVLSIDVGQRKLYTRPTRDKAGVIMTHSRTRSHSPWLAFGSLAHRLPHSPSPAQSQSSGADRRARRHTGSRDIAQGIGRDQPHARDGAQFGSAAASGGARMSMAVGGAARPRAGMASANERGRGCPFHGDSAFASKLGAHVARGHPRGAEDESSPALAAVKHSSGMSVLASECGTTPARPGLCVGEVYAVSVLDAGRENGCHASGNPGWRGRARIGCGILAPDVGGAIDGRGLRREHVKHPRRHTGYGRDGLGRAWLLGAHATAPRAQNSASGGRWGWGLDDAWKIGWRYMLNPKFPKRANGSACDVMSPEIVQILSGRRYGFVEREGGGRGIERRMLCLRFDPALWIGMRQSVGLDDLWHVARDSQAGTKNQEAEEDRRKLKREFSLVQHILRYTHPVPAKYSPSINFLSDVMPHAPSLLPRKVERVKIPGELICGIIFIWLSNLCSLRLTLKCRGDDAGCRGGVRGNPRTEYLPLHRFTNRLKLKTAERTVRFWKMTPRQWSVDWL